MSSRKCNMSENPGREPHDVGVHGEGAQDPIRVHGLASDGRGVARRAGLVWFVARGLPGDLVVLGDCRERRRFGEGRVLRRLADGPDRRVAECCFRVLRQGPAWI